MQYYALYVSHKAEVHLTKFTPANFRRRGLCEVVLHYTRGHQLAYDPAYVDTIVYLPIGTSVWPAMDAAPSGVDAVGWLWAKYVSTNSAREESGWIHPHIIARVC